MIHPCHLCLVGTGCTVLCVVNSMSSNSLDHCTAPMTNIPANTKHSANVGPMLVHRLRRWTNIAPTLFERHVFAGIRPDPDSNPVGLHLFFEPQPDYKSHQGTAQCYGPTIAKMSDDVLAMEKTCSGGDRSRCRMCAPTTCIHEPSANIRRCIGEDSAIILRYIG